MLKKLFFKDDELDEETKSFLNSSAHDEDAILKSPHGSTSSKSPENAGLVDSSSAAAAQHKKVVLKRKLITSLSVNESNSNDAPTDAKVLKTIEPSGDNANNGTHADDVPSTGTVKLTELSMKERLELRAKKFGATPSTDTLKQARAERFGIPAAATKTGATTAKSGSSDSIKKDVVAPPIDLLKKRAERFGGSVSTVLTKMENKEKLLKRQERFGAVKAPTASQPSTETPDTSQPNSDYAEKAKLRLERFKTTVK